MNPSQVEQMASVESIDRMEAPEDGNFPTAEAALQAATQVALTNGYGISRRRSTKSKRNELCKIDVVCDRSRQFVEQGRGQRKTATRKVECPFSIQIKPQLAEGQLASQGYKF